MFCITINIVNKKRYAILILTILFLTSIFYGEVFPLGKKPQEQDKEGIIRNIIIQDGKIRKIIIPKGISEKEQIPEPESKGGSLFIIYCSQCHNLPNPVMYSRDEWSMVFERMLEHARSIGATMKGIELPTGRGKEEIITYLRRNGLKALPRDDPSLKRPDAFQFVWFCSTCHAPPNPTFHTPEEWKKVIKKMNANRKRFGRPMMTKTEMEEVLNFLTEGYFK